MSDPITDAVPVDPFTADLEDRAAAFIAGYDLGLIHGRTAERGVIDQERRSARAGAIVARMAAYPPLDPKELARAHAGRAAARDRLMTRRSA